MCLSAGGLHSEHSREGWQPCSPPAALQPLGSPAAPCPLTWERSRWIRWFSRKRTLFRENLARAAEGHCHTGSWLASQCATQGPLSCHTIPTGAVLQGSVLWSAVPPVLLLGTAHLSLARPAHAQLGTSASGYGHCAKSGSSSPQLPPG